MRRVPWTAVLAAAFLLAIGPGHAHVYGNPVGPAGSPEGIVMGDCYGRDVGFEWQNFEHQPHFFVDQC